MFQPTRFFDGGNAGFVGSYSPDGLTVRQGASPSNFCCVLGQLPSARALGALYFEMQVRYISNTFGVACGVSLTTLIGNGSNDYLGQDPIGYGMGYYPTGGVYSEANNFATLQAYGQGDVISCAVWLGNQIIPGYAGSGGVPASLMWFRVNGGQWNNDVIANQNPATRTGGLALNNHSQPKGWGLPVVPGFGCGSTLGGDIATFNFAGPFRYPPPVGYSGWDVVPRSIRSYTPLLGAAGSPPPVSTDTLGAQIIW